MKIEYKKLIKQNALVKNFLRMWPYIKPYWFRAKQPHFSSMIPFLIVGFTVVQGTLIYASNYLNTWVANKITIGVKRKLYDKLLSMDSSYFDRNNSGTILMRYSHDAEIASTGLIDNLKQFLSKTFASISLVFVLLYNSWQLALIAIAVLLFLSIRWREYAKK